MKIRDLQQPVNEIDRRGFLKGMGAAAVAGAVPGLANAKSTATVPELIAISKKIKSIFAKNIIITGPVPVPTAPGRFRFTFDMQGKLLTKEKPESSGDEKLDQAVLNSATDIPLDIIALFKPEPGSKSVFINITVKDDWWKTGGITGLNARPQTTTTQPLQTSNTVEKVKKALSIFLKGRPNSVVNEITFAQHDNGVEEIYAFGNFGNDDHFAALSPTGVELKGLLSGVGPLRNLSTKWSPLYGGSTTQSIFLSSYETKKDLKQEKFYVDPATNNLSTTESTPLNLSKFSIKGLRFGMTREQVKDIKNKNNISAGVLSALSGGEAVNFGSLLNVSSKPNPNSNEFGAELSYAGMPGYLQYKDNKLVAIVLLNKPDIISEVCQRLMERFPGGEASEQPWQNRMGNTFPNKVYKWVNIDGASILAKVRDSKVNEGSIIFADTNAIRSKSDEFNKQKQNSQKDF